jgi:hypothetical protein
MALHGQTRSAQILTAQGDVTVPERLRPRVRRRAFEISQRTGTQVTPANLVSIAIEQMLAQPVVVNAGAVATARSRGQVR